MSGITYILSTTIICLIPQMNPPCADKYGNASLITLHGAQCRHSTRCQGFSASSLLQYLQGVSLAVYGQERCSLAVCLAVDECTGLLGLGIHDFRTCNHNSFSSSFTPSFVTVTMPMANKAAVYQAGSGTVCNNKQSMAAAQRGCSKTWLQCYKAYTDAHLGSQPSSIA